MIGGMASAFVCARIANAGAQIAEIAHELRLTRERLRREAAQRRAVQI
jgi:predicted transcriptional regulator